MFNDGHRNGESREISGKDDAIKGSNQKALPRIQAILVGEIRDHPGHHPREMILTQAMMGKIMVKVDAEVKAPPGDKNMLTLLTHKWL